MILLDSLPGSSPWLGLTLVQVTLMAAVGMLAWLLARRGGPALRSAMVLAALVGLLAVPVLAMVAPVWLPLPAFSQLDVARPERLGPEKVIPTPLLPEKPRLVANVTTPNSAKPTPGLEGLLEPFDEAVLPIEKAGPVIEADFVADDLAPATPPAEPLNASWTLAGMLAVVWLIGALACLACALTRLALLYRWAWRARPVRDREWIVCLHSLTRHFQLPQVALRESPAIDSPLTMGLFRPVILLPATRRRWSAEQRALVLAHELAHVTRRDFCAGLAAELAVCLYWFHPLVRWLAGQLRLEQEYAADAWATMATWATSSTLAASTTVTRESPAARDSMTYIRCLARLALEQDRGRGALAPAFWRRRPEILRRIDMLRRHPHGQPAFLGRATTWTVMALAAAICLVVAGIGPLRSTAQEPKPSDAAPVAKAPAATADVYGDPLPAGALARLGTTRWRHGSNITFVAFGADGKTLITAGQDATVRLWDLASGKEIRRFDRPKPAEARPGIRTPARIIPPVPAPPANQQAQTDTEKAKAAAEKARAEAERRRLVELQAQVQLRGALRTDLSSLSVALAPDGKTIAVANATVIQLYEVETGKELRTIQGPPTGLTSLLFAADGRTLGARSIDGGFIFWETETGKETRQIKGPQQPQTRQFVVALARAGGDTSGMAFSPDGKSVAAATAEYKEQSFTGMVRVWDLATGDVVREIKAPEGVNVSTIAFAPTGGLLAYSTNEVIHLCEADTGKELRTIRAPEPIVSLLVSPDGKTLATRGRSQQVRVWQVENGKEVCQLGDVEPARSVIGGAVAVAYRSPFVPEVRTLAYSPDGKHIVTAAGGAVRLWDASTGKEQPLSDGHQGALSTIVIAPDGTTAVSWGTDRTIRCWDALTGKLLSTFRLPQGTQSAAFAPDGRAVALAGADNRIRLHEAATGKELQQITGPPGGTVMLAFAPDGKTLAARGNDTIIRFYDLAQGRELRQTAAPTNRNSGGSGGAVTVRLAGAVPSGGRPGLAFSSDGKLLAAPGSAALVAGTRDTRGVRSVVNLYDVATGKLLRNIELAQPVNSYVFSPDGRMLASENLDQSITLYEVASGKARAHFGTPPPAPAVQTTATGSFVVAGGLGVFPSEPAGPLTLAFAPDGRALVARGPDRSVRIWDVDQAKDVGQFPGHQGRIETIAIAADGKTIATGSADTTILLWDAAILLKDMPRGADARGAEARGADATPLAVESLWSDLAGEDAAKALDSVLKLAAAPKQAVPFLGEHLQPAAAVDPQALERWIADLENEKFAVRQEAVASLLKTGEQAVPALQKVLAAQPTIETRKRVEELLDKLTGGTLSSEQLRLVRAIEALERMNTPEAQQVLGKLSRGARGALPTRESQAALARMVRS